MAGAAGTEVVAAELLEEFLVAMDHAVSAANMGFGRVTPSSACYSFRKQERSSTLLMERMMSSFEVSRWLRWAADCARRRVGIQTHLIESADAKVEPAAPSFTAQRPVFLQTRA